MKCPICSKEEFETDIVLKQKLIEEWELNATEVKYINKQQGYHCTNCFCNLRSMTLADSIMKHYAFKGNFKQFCYSKHGKQIKLLEINEAGGLHSFLKEFNRYYFAQYPFIDMQGMTFNDNSFDVIVHSDTLEHIENSLLALQECFRVLKNSGVLFYTIPIIYSRLTRRRDLLPKSYHGSQDEYQGEDYKVYTEYGVDFWVELVNAGFKEVTLSIIDDLSSLAICAKKEMVTDYKGDIFLLGTYLINRFKRKIKKLVRYEIYR
jgi:SAM-dependent methyltransferase